jgi:hypothetical protein
MLFSGEMEELPRPVEPEKVEFEDIALDALLALRARWDAAQGECGATLQALGLELAPQERYLSAVCASHGRFHLLWSAPAASDRPERIECPGDGQIVCRRDWTVDFAYPPAQPPD